MTGRQTDGQTYRQEIQKEREIETVLNLIIYKHMDRQTNIQTERLTKKQTETSLNLKIYKHMDGQTIVRTDGWTGRQTDR